MKARGSSMRLETRYENEGGRAQSTMRFRNKETLPKFIMEGRMKG